MLTNRDTEPAVGQVDMKSLFVLQGINTTFRDTIKRSRKLRRVMFLENTNNKDDTELILNPLCLVANTTCALSPSSLMTWFSGSIPSCMSESLNGEASLSLNLGCSTNRFSRKLSQQNHSWHKTMLGKGIVSRKVDVTLSKGSCIIKHCGTVDSHTVLGDVVEEVMGSL
jgi:hypothetical protein